jgi:hypothetical protein
MQGFTRFFLILTALTFILVGVNTFRDPATALQLMEIRIDNVTALNELRANYGGMMLAIGLLLVYAAFAEWLTRPALLMVAALCAGLATARAIGFVLDGLPNQAVQLFFVLESVGAVVATFLFARRPQPA